MPRSLRRRGPTAARWPKVPFRPFGTFAGLPHKQPTFEGLEKMMVMAEQGKVVELRRPTVGEWDHVVDFEARRSSTTRHHTTSITSCQRDSEPAVDRPPQTGYR